MTASDAERLYLCRPRWAVWSALLFALVFPTAVSWVEILADTPAQPALNLTAIIYAGGKAVQFTFPLLCLWWFRLPSHAAAAGFQRYGPAIGFGLIVAAGMLGLYFGLLRDTPLFATTSTRIQARLDEFGLNTPLGFLVFALFIAVVHSFLEEYYWRWFLFGWLQRESSLGLAVALSAIAFMVPHLFALAVFLGDEYVPAIGLLTLCVGAGGVVWAWLFHRSGSLAAVWLSHFLIDAALFVVGYDLFF